MDEPSDSPGTRRPGVPPRRRRAYPLYLPDHGTEVTR
ncbi:hypothetical protein QFZ75_006718 [Streptomyces sp. V3I8]|nr:hypothetical protein [Streptomyces sp. V3I8]